MSTATTDTPVLPQEQLRLRCLELAVSLAANGRLDYGDVVDLADDFTTFVQP